ncbi:MAG: chromate transporter [Bacteroidales bacterium]|nr:chromate transporter [Bacteroidales bacterium]
MIGLYLQLFWTFFVIGALTIGGGYAMLSLIQDQVVTQHGWLTESAFTDIVGISQMTPGPIGINSATYIGYSVLQEAGASHFMCVLGSLTTTFAVVLPSFIIMMAIVRLYSKLRSNKVFENTMAFLRPAVVGLIGAAAIVLITPANFIDWRSWVLFAAAFIVSMWTKISPILVIIGAGVIGLLIF